MFVGYERAFLLLQNGRVKDAADVCREAIVDDPENDEAHAMLAACLEELGELDEAEDAIRRAIALEPSDADHHRILAEVLVEQRRDNQALSTLKAARELAPDSPCICWRLGEVQLTLGEAPGALRTALAGLALDPSHRGCLLTRARALAQTGQREAAEAEARELIRASPRDEDAFWVLGEILLQSRRPKEAVAAYRQALEITPTRQHIQQALFAARMERFWLYRVCRDHRRWLDSGSDGAWALLATLLALFAFAHVLGLNDVALSSTLLVPVHVYCAWTVASWLVFVGTELILSIAPSSRHARSADERKVDFVQAAFLLLVAAAAVGYLVVGSTLSLFLLSSTALVAMAVLAVTQLGVESMFNPFFCAALLALFGIYCQARGLGYVFPERQDPEAVLRLADTARYFGAIGMIGVVLYPCSARIS